MIHRWIWGCCLHHAGISAGNWQNVHRKSPPTGQFFHFQVWYYQRLPSSCLDLVMATKQRRQLCLASNSWRCILHFPPTAGQYTTQQILTVGASQKFSPRYFPSARGQLKVKISNGCAVKTSLAPKEHSSMSCEWWIPYSHLCRLKPLMWLKQ